MNINNIWFDNYQIPHRLHFDKSFLWIIALKLQKKYVEWSSSLPKITQFIA